MVVNFHNLHNNYRHVIRRVTACRIFATEESRKLIDRLFESAELMKQLMGRLCGAIVSIDQTDEVRVTFDSG